MDGHQARYKKRLLCMDKPVTESDQPTQEKTGLVQNMIQFASSLSLGFLACSRPATFAIINVILILIWIIFVIQLIR